MTLEQEKNLIGEKLDEVPQIDPGEYCNGKTKMKEDCSVVRDGDGDSIFGGYCGAKAGMGTDHLGEGRCMYHGGCSTGAPEGNQNRTTHGLNADLENYHEALDEDGQEFVENISEAILDRLRTDYSEIDSLDRKLARQVGVKFHIVSKASDYVENESGLIETTMTENGSRERSAALLEEVRKYDLSIFDDLKKLGVLDDPDSRQADALEEWRNFIEGKDS